MKELKQTRALTLEIMKTWRGDGHNISHLCTNKGLIHYKYQTAEVIILCKPLMQFYFSKWPGF